MRSRLHHFTDTLWYSEELGKVGSMSITPNGSVMLECVDDDGNPYPRRWHPRDVELIAADDPENYYVRRQKGEVLQ